MAEAIILKFVKNTGTKHEDLIINGYKYKWCRNNKDNTSNYKCRVKNPTSNKECQGSCTLDSYQGTRIVRLNFEHDHEPISQIELDVEEFKRKNKTKVQSEMSIPVQQIFEDGQVELGEEYSAEELTQAGLACFNSNKNLQTFLKLSNSFKKKN